MATEDKVNESIRILIEGEASRPEHLKESNIVTICMVPDTLRNLNPGAYTPRITSIGPLHRGDQRLISMEAHKVAYMYRLFFRTVEATKKDMKQIKHECVQEISGVVTRARDCYAPSFAHYEDSKFAEMMIIDGCFILELLYRFEYGIGEGDPIFDNILVKHDIKNDLLLLENQIPFFILKKLFPLTLAHILKHAYLTDFVFHFFEDMKIIDGELTITDEIEILRMEHCHILGFFQSCYRPKARQHGEIPTISYSATEIAGAGVRFKAPRPESSLLQVEFKQLPFVPGLIDTTDDVSLLVRSKVLQHHLGASEDVTNLFNNICNGVVLRDFYYTEEWRQLDEYCNQFWPSKFISLRRLYRSTTWKTLTVIAAMIIFAVTLVQTIFTILNG